MPRNISILSLLLCLSLCHTVNAKQRSVTEMKAIAAGIIANNSNSRATAQAKEIEVLKTTDCTTILGYMGGQFVVVANDDSFNAVLAYSDDNAEYTGDLPDGFIWWLNAINETLKERLSTGNTVMPLYGIGDDFNDFTPTTVSPILTCQWSQGEPYNNYCPIDYDDRRSLVGCVATAMAQTMFKFKYPEKGQGEASYIWENSKGTRTRLTQDLSESTYKWSLMPNKISYGIKDEVKDALATLSRDCGYTLNMHYGCTGSGTLTRLVKTALINHFGYNEGIRFHQRKYFGTDEWVAMIKAELAAKRPVIYGAFSPGTPGTADAGHCFVLDGYNRSGLFHVNWGWGGQSDCYADIETLIPYGTSYKYTDSQEAIFGVCPEKISEKSIQLYCKGEPTLKMEDNTLQSTLTIWNLEGDAFDGSRAYFLRNMENGADIILYERDFQLAAMQMQPDGVGKEESKYVTFSAPIPEDLAAGTYRLFAATKIKGSSTWLPIRYPYGNINSYLLTKDATGAITSEGDKSTEWMTQEEISAIEEITVSEQPSHLKGNFNLSGQKVNANYKGLVIKNGKKIISK